MYSQFNSIIDWDEKLIIHIFSTQLDMRFSCSNKFDLDVKFNASLNMLK